VKVSVSHSQPVAGTSRELDFAIVSPVPPDFSITYSGGFTPAPLFPGESLSVGLSVNSLNGFQGQVTVGFVGTTNVGVNLVSGPGDPFVTKSFLPSTVDVSSTSPGLSTATLTLSPAATPATYVFNIPGTAQSVPSLTRTSSPDLSLSVWDFSLADQVAAPDIPAGGSSPGTLRLTSHSGFDQAVTLSGDVTCPGCTIAFATPAPTISANSFVDVPYAITVPSAVAPGTFSYDLHAHFSANASRRDKHLLSQTFQVLPPPPPQPATGHAFVNNFGSNTVSVIDVTTDTVVKTIPVGPGPGPILFSPNFTKAYVGNFNANTVSVIDSAAMSVSRTVTVGSGPCNFAFTPNGAKAYVTNFNSNSVTVLDVNTDTVLKTVVVGAGPCALMASPNGALVYIANMNAGTVSVIDTSADSVTATITVGATPFPVTFAPNGAKAYVVNQGSNSVSVLDVVANRELKRIAVGNSPRDLAILPDSSKAYVANFGSLFTLASVSVLDLASDTVTRTIQIGGFDATLVEVSPNGTELYVGHTGSPFALGDISVLDPASDTVTRSFGVGHRPSIITFTPDGVKAYVANINSDTVSVIDTATDSVVTTVTVGDQPVDIAITPVTSIANTLTGTWTGSWTSNISGGGPLNAVITQNGIALTGSVALATSGCLPTGTVSGSLSGATLVLGAVSGSGVQVNFTGTIGAGNTSLSGTYQVVTGSCRGDTGTWSLTKN
jgi:YVTN family beta-propeller protein